MKELIKLRNSSIQEFEKIFGYLKMKAMKSSDFCLMWDDLFVPGSFMVNKGKDDYFVPAFCSGDPFKREHLEAI